MNINTNIATFSLPKKEHLCGEIRIQELYQKGKSFLVYPIKVVYITVPREEVAVKVMFSVAKRNFKHAVDRNRVKRLMREAYRLQKSTIIDIANEKNISVHIALSYISKDLPQYKLIYKKTTKLIEKLNTST